MDKSELTQNKLSFSELTYQHLTYCLKSYDQREYFSSAVWAAVFVEAILKDILHQIDGKTHNEELNALINNVKNYVNSTSANIVSSDRTLLRDIAGRCNEIKLKRNRLVHDTGVSRSKIDIDAADIHNNIAQITSHYLKTTLSGRIRAANLKAQNNGSNPAVDPDFPIFISTITPHTFEQEEFLEAFCEKLRLIGVKPVRCFLTDFDKKDPMGKVRDTIAQCKAVIVIGLERSHAYYFKDKERSQKESEGVHRLYSSSWLQLESGMAVALKKDVFVLCQHDIHSDGIFDREWNSYSPIEMPVPLDVNSKNVQMMLREIQEYVNTHRN